MNWSSSQVTEDVFHLLKDDYNLESRGVVVVKGKGEMNTYFLLSKKPIVLEED